MKRPPRKAANGNFASQKAVPAGSAPKGPVKKNATLPPTGIHGEVTQEMSLLLNNTDESFVLVNTNFQIIFFNKQFQVLYKKYFDKDARQGDSILEYAQPHRRDVVKEIYQAVFKGERLQSEIELPLPDGSVSIFINRFKPAYDNEGEMIGAFVTITDITEKKETERTMGEERMLLRTLIDNLPLHVYTKDLDSRKTLANRTDYEYAGFDKEEGVLGKNDLELFSEESAKNTMAEDRHIFTTGKSIIGKEERHIRKDGSEVWFLISKIPFRNADNEVLGLLGISYNVTERKEAQEKIRIAKERYDIVTKATNEAIWDWDMISNQVHWGDGFRTLFGHNSDTDLVTLEAWTSFIHPDDEKNVIASMMNVVNSTQISKWEEEYRFKKQDGEYASVLDRGFVIRNAQGKPTRMIGAMQDITHRKQAEQSLRESEEKYRTLAEELAASNKELEQFAYVASHDLQEPLRMVSSFLQLLQKKYTDQLDETAFQYINYAVDGADRMKQLIMDLLEYSRVGTNQDKRVRVDMSEAITQVLDMFAAKIEETKAVIKVLSMPVIKVNKTQITQLIQNLVGNALKYNNSPVPHVEIGCKENPDTWQFWVKDNGIGIEPKFFEKVFIIFQRLHNKNQFSGTGIGLAICKKIVERHGGQIWIESAPEKGSTFFFTIRK